LVDASILLKKLKMLLLGFGLTLPFADVGGGFFADLVMVEGVARAISGVVELVTLGEICLRAGLEDWGGVGGRLVEGLTGILED
jgi:hypothetical protein